MATISISLADAFEQSFGYRTQAFNPEFSELPARTLVSSSGTDYYDKDASGTEYFMPVTLATPAANGNEAKDYKLPFPVISIMARKHIIETPLTERNGTVKEMINVLDYEIAVKGMIVAKGNNFPEDDVTALRQLYEVNGPVQMKCALTDIFLLRPGRKGSDTVVVKELHFLPVTGIKGVRPYEMRLVSDEIFSLEEITTPS